MIKDESGQSMVEYIMLMGVIFILVLTVLKNDKFKELLGPNSTIVNGMRESMMYSYRHGRPGLTSTDQTQTGYTGRHDTYTNEDGSGSRFFSNDDPYPAAP